MRSGGGIESMRSGVKRKYEKSCIAAIRSVKNRLILVKDPKIFYSLFEFIKLSIQKVNFQDLKIDLKKERSKKRK